MIMLQGASDAMKRSASSGVSEATRHFLPSDSRSRTEMSPSVRNGSGSTISIVGSSGNTGIASLPLPHTLGPSHSTPARSNLRYTHNGSPPSRKRRYSPIGARIAKSLHLLASFGVSLRATRLPQAQTLQAESYKPSGHLFAASLRPLLSRLFLLDQERRHEQAGSRGPWSARGRPWCGRLAGRVRGSSHP